jgi:hypothetical protein
MYIIKSFLTTVLLKDLQNEKQHEKLSDGLLKFYQKFEVWFKKKRRFLENRLNIQSHNQALMPLDYSLK